MYIIHFNCGNFHKTDVISNWLTQYDANRAILFAKANFCLCKNVCQIQIRCIGAEHENSFKEQIIPG